MRLGGRLAAAIEVLADVEALRRPVADALRDWGLGHRFAGSGDRAAIGNIVYDALRRRASIGWAMGAETPRALALGAVGRHWSVGAEGLTASLEGDPHAPSPLIDAERAGLVAEISEAPPHIRADIPEWLAPHFEAAFGPDWAEEGAALAARPPLDMRANPLKAARDKVLKALARQNASATPFAPEGLRIAPTRDEARHPNVQAESAFQKGWFEIQDEGSQLAALLSGAKPGDQILDLCAGAGGKTLALGVVMENKGQIHATDSDRTRLAPIHERLRRAGTRNVQVHDTGAPLDVLAGRMDRVLIDAPCTGVGTWRRRPDAKWRLSERALADRRAEQAALLDQSIGFLKPGGAIAYVTCSLLPGENAEQVRAFADRHEGFAVTPGAELLAGSALPQGAKAGLAAAALLSPEGVILTPRRTGTDGFFVALLKRA
jgi:16S rRNA (cytosine967-C5)-methyltransferase